MRKVFKVRNTINKKFVDWIRPWMETEKYRVRYSDKGGRIWYSLLGAQRFLLNINYCDTSLYHQKMYDTPEWVFWHKTLISSLEVVECSLVEDKIYSMEEVISTKEGQRYKEINEQKIVYEEKWDKNGMWKYN